MFIKHGSAVTAAIETASSNSYTNVMFSNFAFTVAMGAPGIAAGATPSAVFTAATKTLVVTVGSFVHTFAFMNSNTSTLFNVTISLTCTIA